MTQAMNDLILLLRDENISLKSLSDLGLAQNRPKTGWCLTNAGYEAANVISSENEPRKEVPSRIRKTDSQTVVNCVIDCVEISASTGQTNSAGFGCAG